MIVSSNNNLLNILLPNDNNVLKETLKNADAKTLENLAKGTTSVGDILKNLFDDLKSGDKNKSNIEQLLKNSNVFKEFGSFSKSISTLMEQLDSSFDKYKPMLENFAKDISKLDNNQLKELIAKSGVFLESKALNQGNVTSNLPKNFENLLTQIKTLLQDIPTLEAKNISASIDKLLQATPSKVGTENITTQIKDLITQLQSLSKGLSDTQLSNLSNLTNSLKTISDDGQLLESKIQNFSNQGQINNNQQTLVQDKQTILNKTLDTLFQLRAEIQQNNTIPNSQSLIKQIDTLIQTKDLFNKNTSQMDVKNLLTQLTQLDSTKQVSEQNTNISNLVNNLKTQTESLTNLQSQVLQNQNVQVEKNDLMNNIQQTLLSLKSEVSSITNVDTKLINQIIDKLLNIQNLFSKVDIPLELNNLQNTQNTNFQSNFANNLNELVLNLKESIVNLSSSQDNLNLQNTIFKNIDKLETIANSLINNPALADKANPNSNLQHDMKAVLLQMQGDLQGKTDTNSLDTSKQIDRIITQIEYHQLLSTVSNSNNVYIPFIWDMLDEGSISMKKLDEERFYCEINLSLKEFGQTQLLLSMYDKNKLDITVYVSNEDFKKTFRENSTKLKQALNKVDLIPTSLKIIEIPKETNKKEPTPTNSYGQNQEISMGLDIRV